MDLMTHTSQRALWDTLLHLSDVLRMRGVDVRRTRFGHRECRIFIDGMIRTGFSGDLSGWILMPRWAESGDGSSCPRLLPA